MYTSVHVLMYIMYMQVHQGAASGLEAAQGRPAAGGGQEAAVQCEQAGPHQVCHVLHGGVRDEVSLTLPVQSPSGLLPNDLVVADDDGDPDEDPGAVLLLVTDDLKRLLPTAKLGGIQRWSTERRHRLTEFIVK